MMAVVICMVAAIAIRSLITNIYLSKIMGVSNEINVIWECVAMIVVTVTMFICSVAYEVVMRIAPWMVGKKKKKTL